jgi:molybdopterin converting factor small subunit
MAPWSAEIELLLQRMSEMISVRVLLFSTIRGIIGERELSLDLPEDSTIGDLKEEIARLYPASDPAVRSMLTAVNRIFSEDETVLPDQAEVAFFPHVAGG